MATSAQKRALEEASANLNRSKTAQAASLATMNTSRNNYTNLANKGYTQSNQTKTQLNNYNATMNAAKAVLQKGVGYTNKYDNKIESLLDRAENGKMQYSVTEDPAYKALQNTYVNQGRIAMQNAVGEAVGATGGYGSTVAAAAGQAAYNQSLTELNAHVADLYDKAAGRFNNQQNLLVTLADSYRQQDAQGWEHAYNEWNSKFSGYAQLADEYLKGYEYMDDADRKAYETRLDAYWNLLTSAQSQYNADGDRVQNALSQYSNTASDIANYEETLRANLANESLAKAQLAEQQRQFNAEMNYKTLESQAKFQTAATKATNNTKQFQAAIRTPKEFGRRQSTSDYKNYADYNSYVGAMIKQWLDDGKLSDAEAEYLYNSYNLGG